MANKQITNKYKIGKYKIGQEVFYIEDRSITKSRITGAYVYDLNDPDGNVWYAFNSDPDKMEDNAMPESDLFPTRESLIKSL